MPEAPPTVLVLTVGGSAEPLLTAIRAARPARTLFVCSKESGEDAASSRTLLDGEDGVPRRAGLDDSAWETVAVPHDDPDAAFATLRARLKALRRRFPEARLIADYTGGTKSMSAALMAAALEWPGVQLQVTTGTRRTLDRVASGTERPRSIAAELIGAERRIGLMLHAWRRYGYEEAAAGFDLLRRDLDGLPRSDPLRVRMVTLADLSHAFAAWDRFEHAAALQRLKSPHERHADFVNPYREAAKVLVKPNEREPLALVDLWNNAERRAARGRYDDAVARLYRLAEWTAQWLLRRDHGIDTSNIPEEKVPRDSRAKLEPTRKGGYQASLVQAWILFAELSPESPAARAMTHPGTDGSCALDRLRKVLNVRNYSILAHGRSPIGEEKWCTVRAWFEDELLPLIRSEAGGAADTLVLPQLPTDPPDDLV